MKPKQGLLRLKMKEFLSIIIKYLITTMKNKDSKSNKKLKNICNLFVKVQLNKLRHSLDLEAKKILKKIPNPQQLPLKKMPKKEFNKM